MITYVADGESTASHVLESKLSGTRLKEFEENEISYLIYKYKRSRRERGRGDKREPPAQNVYSTKEVEREREREQVSKQRRRRNLVVSSSIEVRGKDTTGRWKKTCCLRLSAAPGGRRAPLSKVSLLVGDLLERLLGAGFLLVEEGVVDGGEYAFGIYKRGKR